MSCSLGSTSLSSAGTITLSCLPSADGVYAVTVIGTSGSLSHSISVTITSSTPDFVLSANSASFTIEAGGSDSTVIRVIRTNGFTGAVSLNATVSPSGPTFAFNTTSISSSSRFASFSIAVSSSITPGTYTITVQGSSGPLSHTTKLTVIVTSPSAGSNILGLPPTTFYALIAIVIIAAVGVALYFVRFRKKPTPSRSRFG